MGDTSRQLRQQQRRAEWEKEGHLEWPQQLATMLQPHQLLRFQWLKDNAVGTIMELGCNWGFVLGYVGGHTGIDISPDCLKVATLVNRGRLFIQADITQMLDEFEHDTVMVPDVLEHLAWEDVPKVLDYAKRCASMRVLVTIPDGRTDSVEATNMKHQWLADDEKIADICDMLGSFASHEDGNFIYWRVDKP